MLVCLLGHVLADLSPLQALTGTLIFSMLQGELSCCMGIWNIGSSSPPFSPVAVLCSCRNLCLHKCHYIPALISIPLRQSHCAAWVARVHGAHLPASVLMQCYATTKTIVCRRAHQIRHPYSILDTTWQGTATSTSRCMCRQSVWGTSSLSAPAGPSIAYREVAGYAMDTLRSLSHVHRRGVLHKALLPKHILVS